MRKAAFLSILVACGGGQQTPVAENVHLAAPDAAVVAQPNKTIEKLGIPRDAPLVATFDATALAKIEPLRAELERDFDLGSGSLLDNAALLGFDTKRPVTIALAPLDDAQTKLVADLRAAGPTDAMLQRVSEMKSPIAVRILVPATSPTKLEETIGKVLHAEHWHHTASGWETHDMTIELDDDGQNVAVDVFAARKHDPQLARAFKSTAREAPPAVGDRTLRASWSPAALASLGYLSEVIKAVGAVSGGSVDPSQRARILQEGFSEAARGFAVATFDRVEVEGQLSPFELVGRARPSASFTAPPADAFAQAPGVAVPGAVVLAQATRAFIKGWSFPGGSPAELLGMIRDGGAGAVFAGLPHVLAASAVLDSRRSRATLPFDLGRFERVATSYSPSSDEVYVSILPAGTKRPAAECAFAPKTPCDAKTRLKLNAVTKIDSLNAKLLEIDKRFVVVSSESETLPTPTLVPTAGALRLDVDTSMAAKLLAPSTLPPHLSGEMASDSGALVFRLTQR
jgi:hypothetical protein